jgi:hypothetical protein
MESPESLKVVIAGSRSVEDPQLVYQAIESSGFVVREVVSGGAYGVDALGEVWAREQEVPVRVFKPDWGRYGRGAGPVRNREMADYADALVAVWDGESKGTADMIRQMEERGKPVYVVQVESESS